MNDFNAVAGDCGPSAAAVNPGSVWGSYGRRGAEASRKVNANRRRRKPVEEQPAAAPEPPAAEKKLPHPSVGHNPCTCGRMKRGTARCCFRCGEYDHAIFDHLDRLIRAGVNEPQEKLPGLGADPTFLAGLELSAAAPGELDFGAAE